MSTSFTGKISDVWPKYGHFITEINPFRINVNPAFENKDNFFQNENIYSEQKMLVLPSSERYWRWSDSTIT